MLGDKSAVDVVAHEIAHSWMGNLVTTSNWEHFWLNEGWTVFIERKIAGKKEKKKRQVEYFKKKMLIHIFFSSPSRRSRETI